MSPAIAAIVSGILDLGKDWYKRKKEKTQLKHEVTLKQLEQDSDLIKGGINSWKDEWWTLIVTLPLIQLMIAPVVELFMIDEPYARGDWTTAILEGLQALEQVPDWHIYIATASALYSFGLKPTVQNLAKARIGRKNEAS